MPQKFPDEQYSIVHDNSKPPRTRAEFLILTANELGYDLMPVVEKLITEIDANEKLAAQVKELSEKIKDSAELHPLVPEIFLEHVSNLAGPAVRVLTQAGTMVLPVQENLPELHCGDTVLVDKSNGVVVGVDSKYKASGDVATIDDIGEADQGLVVVKHVAEKVSAHIPESLATSPDLKPGAEVVFDRARRFVHRILGSRLAGDELLTPASELSGFTLDDLGAPHPVVGQILNICKRAVLHADWETRLRSRRRRSYLFYGPSGGGKTSHIKALVNAIADWMETLTGVREPRVVFCDASHFYSPYLGESEQRITDWFAKLGAIARKEVKTKDGQRVLTPLTVVLEEVESLVRKRGEFGSSGHLFDRLLSLILQKMDEASNNLDVPLIFICSTNMKPLMDFAARRRFAQREVYFGTLRARDALSVLEKKIPETLPIDGQGDPATRRRELLRSTLNSLFGSGQDQAVAEVVFRDSRRQQVYRRELVTGALIDSAVGEAIDLVLERSTNAGQLLGLDSPTLQECFTRQFEAIATSLTPFNLQDYLPSMSESGDAHVANVRPIQQPRRRGAGAYLV